MTSCAFNDPSGATCGQSWTVVRPQDGRRPFIGCQGWQPGDPRTRDGGHMGCSLKDGVDAELLEKYRKDGLLEPELVAAGNCTYIASKNHRGRVCNGHGGEDPPLVRAGVGTCKVRARL